VKKSELLIVKTSIISTLKERIDEKN